RVAVDLAPPLDHTLLDGGARGLEPWAERARADRATLAGLAAPLTGAASPAHRRQPEDAADGAAGVGVGAGPAAAGPPRSARRAGRAGARPREPPAPGPAGRRGAAA